MKRSIRMWRTQTSFLRGSSLRPAGLHALLVLTLLGCAGTFNGVTFDRRGRLEQAGFQVRELRGGWVRLTGPEGYSFVMPSAPSVEEERVEFAGVSIPHRYFELSADQNSRAFMVRVFDTRELNAEARDALQREGAQLFRPSDSNVQFQRSVRQNGLDVEVTVLDGFGTTGRHMGILHSFQEAGFVWFMMVIYEDGGGGPGNADAFLARQFEG